MLQSLAVEKFHRDEGFAVRFADIVNRADVGMVQGGGGLGFSLETREGLRIFRDVVRQEFQRDETMQADVFGFVHDAHAATAEAFQDAIVGKSLVEERVVAGHVVDILGCGKRQVNEDAVLACECRHNVRNAEGWPGGDSSNLESCGHAPAAWAEFVDLRGLAAGQSWVVGSRGLSRSAAGRDQ